MCEAAAYLLKGDEEELILNGVDLIETDGNKVKIVDMFGEVKEVRARIKRFSLIDHKIILEPL